MWTHVQKWVEEGAGLGQKVDLATEGEEEGRSEWVWLLKVQLQQGVWLEGEEKEVWLEERWWWEELCSLPC